MQKIHVLVFGTSQNFCFFIHIFVPQLFKPADAKPVEIKGDCTLFFLLSPQIAHYRQISHIYKLLSVNIISRKVTYVLVKSYLFGKKRSLMKNLSPRIFICQSSFSREAEQKACGLWCSLNPKTVCCQIFFFVCLFVCWWGPWSDFVILSFSAECLRHTHIAESNLLHSKYAI